MNQPPPVRKARAARDAALKAVDDAASAKWKEDAWRFLQKYAATHREVFVDDLWDAGLPHTREDRALGPLFLRAQREGIIERTGRYRPSVRSHLTDKPVWKSKIYRRRKAA